MSENKPKLAERDEIQLLAKFRSEIRRFLRFSEKAAAAAGLEPQQHQLLLQIAGAPKGTLATISYIAEAMSLQHHTTVELSKRCELAELVRRTHDPSDRRCVVLELTAKGQEALRGLSRIHAQQLRNLAPVLIQALTSISNANGIAQQQLAKDSEEGVPS
jgi:DNA-binding MarR family transcriptional regulator